MTDINQQVILKKTPEGVPTANNFDVVDGGVPQCGDGQILVKNLYLSLDPYMRSQMAGRHVTGSVGEGDVCLGETIGEVIESKSEAWVPLVEWSPSTARPLGVGLSALPGDKTNVTGC